MPKTAPKPQLTAVTALNPWCCVRYQTGIYAGTVRAGCPALTRYADDLVVCCYSRQQAEQVKAQLAEWLEPRGLAVNEAKTRIVPLSEGFDFLGFNLRRYPNVSNR